MTRTHRKKVAALISAASAVFDLISDEELLHQMTNAEFVALLLPVGAVSAELDVEDHRRAREIGKQSLIDEAESHYEISAAGWRAIAEMKATGEYQQIIAEIESRKRNAHSKVNESMTHSEGDARS
jgi:hypothetical protein